MDKDIMTALIAVIPSLLAGLFLIINTKLSKRMDKVLIQTKDNDILTVENNLLEKLLPVFEAKDEALDKIADILAEDRTVS
jgi:K+/H+ antiporter YhaU regulatory subunit KhtT